MPLTAVTEALKRIAGPEDCDASVQAASTLCENICEYFCIEDTLLSKDIDVTVEGVGKLSFPLMEENIKKIMKVSSKAKFGRGEETVLDTSVRDTQMISASNLKVDINDDALSGALERMCTGLNLDRSASLVPHLYNMLIYGKGQFFKMHRDSEKMKNMVATLVILLPSVHKGGDLIIQHNDKKHIFFCSKNPEIVKCVIFYSDCQHEIKEVTDGYRVALTFNVVLDVSKVTNDNPLDEDLNNAVHNYFNTPRISYLTSNNNPTKLVYFLNHSYSEHSLKWDLLKGVDRSCALALLTVAKHQGRLPCLALADHMETYDAEDSGDSDLLSSETTLYFWVNENSLQFKETNTKVNDDEMCFTEVTSDIFKPFKTEESGPTGNEGETRDHWYKRACVVLWTHKWVCSTGFKDAIFDLHCLTTSDGNEDIIRSDIDNAGEYFYQTKMWNDTGVGDLLIDIVRYVNDSNIAIDILSKLPLELLKEDKFDCFLQLERQFDNETWLKIFTGWKQNSNWDKSSKMAVKFVERYVKNQADVSKSVAVLLLKACGDAFIKRTRTYTNQNQSVFSMRYSYNINTTINCRYIYDKKTSSEISDELCSLLYLCVVFKNSLLENRLIQHVKSTPSVFPSQGLAEIYFKLKKIQPSESERYKVLADTALATLHHDLAELKKHGESWYWPVHIPCGCQFCVKVQSFFHSPGVNKVLIPAAAHHRAHVYSFLNPLTEQPVSFNTQRRGSPYKIEIEKNKKLLSDRKSLIKELIDLENKLLACTTLMDSNEDSNNLASTSGNQNLNQPINAVEESVVPAKRIKM